MIFTGMMYDGYSKPTEQEGESINDLHNIGFFTALFLHYRLDVGFHIG
jgi:hypothetical protein